MTISAIYSNFWKFWKCSIFWTLLTICYIVDNFWQFLTIWQLWQCWHFLPFCQYWPFRLILTISDKDQYKDINKDSKHLWHLRHWLQFWQLRTWIHDNLFDLTINCDTGQHLQFLRCFFPEIFISASFKSCWRCRFNNHEVRKIYNWIKSSLRDT